MTPGGKLLQAAVRQTHDPVARVAARNKEAPCLLFVAFRATWFAVFGVVSLLAELPGSPSSLFARLELVPLADLGRVCTRCGAGVPHSAVRVADRTSRHSAVCRGDATAHVCRQPSRRPTSRHTWQGEPPPRHWTQRSCADTRPTLEADCGLGVDIPAAHALLSCNVCCHPTRAWRRLSVARGTTRRPTGGRPSNSSSQHWMACWLTALPPPLLLLLHQPRQPRTTTTTTTIRTSRQSRHPSCRGSCPKARARSAWKRRRRRRPWTPPQARRRRCVVVSWAAALQLTVRRPCPPLHGRQSRR